MNLKPHYVVTVTAKNVETGACSLFYVSDYDGGLALASNIADAHMFNEPQSKINSAKLLNRAKRAEQFILDSVTYEYADSRVKRTVAA